ncbi:MAG TPA: HAMP domain-containing sensor histidine kinase [Chitinophagaceae bacterium]|nr:HAMP domain-containing sensor histidine kinase [Chitinophagaceae bacterium]
MIRQWLNIRTLFFFVAICIVTGTIFYSNYLSKKIADDERHKVEIWAEAQRAILTTSDQGLMLASNISIGNKDIPIIETNENDVINPNNCVNLDSTKIKDDSTYLPRMLKHFKSQHKPIVYVITEKPYSANKYYYGESVLQQEVRYYPLVQLVIVGLFIIVTVIAQRTSYRSTQNQVWAGMAKETAHQLGTPVTSLKGWVEVLRDIPGNEKIISDIEKDITRLELITDRFGKIGSQPQLEERNVVEQVQNMITYMRKRAGGRVDFKLLTGEQQNVVTKISPPLFDWVIENLLKNALDAMEGRGTITVTIQQVENSILIDVADTGKGISAANINKVFKPGFTTKKRGWGLGLTLTKRIIEQYHKGKIFVKGSEPGKGTTFRIELKKS